MAGIDNTKSTELMKKYLDFCKKMLSLHEDYSDNADYNSRVKVRLEQLLFEMSKVVGNNYSILVKLNNNKEICITELGDYFDYRNIAYRHNSDNWLCFDVSQVVSISIGEKFSKVVNEGVVDIPTPTLEDNIVNEYRSLMDEQYDDGNKKYSVTLDKDGLVHINIIQPPSEAEEGCDCEECKSILKKEAKEAKKKTKINVKKIVEDSLNTCYRKYFGVNFDNTSASTNAPVEPSIIIGDSFYNDYEDPWARYGYNDNRTTYDPGIFGVTTYAGAYAPAVAQNPPDVETPNPNRRAEATPEQIEAMGPDEIVNLQEELNRTLARERQNRIARRIVRNEPIMTFDPHRPTNAARQDFIQEFNANRVVRQAIQAQEDEEVLRMINEINL